MQFDLLTLYTSLAHTWEVASEAIIGAVAVAGGAYALRKIKEVFSNGSRWITGVIKRRQSCVSASLRWVLRRENNLLRTYRFDTVWINREVVKGQASLIIFLLWFGFWMLAVGLKELVVVADGPLSQSPVAVLITSSPMYFFEFMWIFHASRAAKVIKYRQKVKIWRFRHAS